LLLLYDYVIDQADSVEPDRPEQQRPGLDLRYRL
ncbi:unnamed protein product, partial [marine sediment metagenome]